MRFKSIAVQPIAQFITQSINRDAQNAPHLQERILFANIAKAQQTKFGKEHNFAHIRTYADYKRQVPLRDYEQLKPYFDLLIQGKADVLWPQKPLYFAKTSGTTSGTKYIPITRDSISNHFNSARNALFAYIAETRKSQFFDGKMIFLSGSPELTRTAGIHTGRLSGIVNHHIPQWLRSNQLPTYTTNCIEDWEEKLTKIVEETIHQDMRLISGIPPWTQMYFDRLTEQSGRSVGELFPNFSVLVHGGVNFKPYQAKMEASIGRKVDIVETYPASEGFIAYQNSQTHEGLLLNTNSGIFFEFVPATEIHDANPTRLSLAEVQMGVNYALIINNNAGLWGYIIGDTVRFVSLNPYKIVVTGRIKHYISAFGEHVIPEEVEQAILSVIKNWHEPVSLVEFTVAPMVTPPKDEKPYHEWFVEFDQKPTNLPAFAAALDQAMQQRNIYYADLQEGNILQPLKIRALHSGAFQQYMKSIGKLGGQNKVPRLSNDRDIVDKF
ncbi:MAG: GH3 auxin-responsive promoter family protein [Chitinophagales bacterium]|nr:GH3 auxin-responsive promoter family protein [Chitinophagales bacterium]